MENKKKLPFFRAATARLGKYHRGDYDRIRTLQTVLHVVVCGSLEFK